MNRMDQPGELEKRNIRLAMEQARSDERRAKRKSFVSSILSKKQASEGYRKFSKGFVPRQGSNSGAVRAQFPRPTNDKKPGKSKILTQDNEFFSGDYDGPRYL